MAARRNAQIDFAAFQSLDRERREFITAGESLKASRNRASEEIVRRKRAGESADDLLTEMKRVSEDISRRRRTNPGARRAPAGFHAGDSQCAALVGAGWARRERQCRSSPMGRAAKV